MRYLAIYRPTSGVEGGAPDPAHMEAMGKLTEESMANGSLLGVEPLTVRAAGGRIRLADGQFTVSDETARASGYAILNAASREEALDFCRTFLTVAGDGEVELRQILDMPPMR